MNATASPEQERIEAFKDATAAKLRQAICPVHGRPPVLRFHGSSLRDVTINVSGCCELLLSIANRAVANR